MRPHGPSRLAVSTPSLDGRMRVNWAYYNSEYEDQQVSTFVGLGFVVTNAASTEIQGFEVDAAFRQLRSCV